MGLAFRPAGARAQTPAGLSTSTEKMKKSKFRRFFFLLRRGSVLKPVLLHLKHKLEKRQPKLIPRVELSEVVKPTVAETILDSPNADLDGNVSPYELRVICKVVKHYKPRNLFEIGTFDGRTTVNLAANSSNEARIYTLDLAPREVNQTELRIKSSDATFIAKQQSGREFMAAARAGQAKKITQLWGDSAAFDYSDYDSRMDFVFVDGSHSYEYVLNDTRVALNLLKDSKGIIMWHDYGWREVVRALNELYMNDPKLNILKHIKDTSLVIYNKDSV